MLYLRVWITVDAEMAKAALGERTVHSISIETHIPRLGMLLEAHAHTPSFTLSLITHTHTDSCEGGGGGRTYASATANISPSSLRDEKGATQAALRDKIPFFSGIPAVECIKGVMRLFKHRCTYISGRVLVTWIITCVLVLLEY